MRLLRPIDDFLNRSLGVLSNIFERLLYLAELRDEGGEYQHWGLTNTYGREKALKAISQSHTLNFVEFLRTPLWTLAEELRQSAQSHSISERAYLETVLRDKMRLLPEALGGGSKQHFKSVLLVLQMMEQPTHPAA